DRTRAGALRHPLRLDRARHLPHPDDGRHAARRAGLARRAGALPLATRPAGGVRAAGREHLRDPDAERRDHPPGWGDPHATQVADEATVAQGETTETIKRDVMEYDVVIVGAGPAGLACAIRLKQLKP